MKKKPVPLKDETVDGLLSGRLSVLQKKGGYRFSLDAILLAHFVRVRGAKRVVDLGSGNGVIPLILTSLYPSVRVTGLEIQDKMVDRALRNIAMNDVQDRVEILQGDVISVDKRLPPGSFDLALSNPPYRRLSSGRVSPDPERYVARHEAKVSLTDFLHAGATLLPAGGSMALIYPATRAVDLLVAMRGEGLEPKRLRFVYPFAHGPAEFVLAEGVKGAGSEVRIMSPLIVYAGEKKYTEEVKAMLKGK